MTDAREKKKNIESSTRGISMQKMNLLMAAVTVIISVLLLIAAYLTSGSYQRMRASADEYIDDQQTAFQLQNSSDFLTEQVRCFTVTGERAYVDNYFREANVTRRRDRALDTLEAELAGTEAYHSLTVAMEQSTALMEREFYAMRLAIDAFGYSLTSFPKELQSVRLSDADAALSSEEKGELARTLVFDPTYRAQKEAINNSVQNALDELVTITEEKMDESSESLRSLLIREQWLIAILIVAVLAIVLLSYLLVISPLLRAVILVRADQPMPVKGSYEFRFLARTYNLMYEANRESREHLAYEATHDQLTGLYNRNGFDFLRKNVDFSNVALLLFDLDKFKGINDTFGHEAGDRALAWMAGVVKEHFRTSDYLCRIGGDEFAAIMVGAGKDNAGLIEKKINAINRKLNVPEDDLPPASISAGVAFGAMDLDVKDIYRHADEALYSVKNSGGCGCAFYDELHPEAEG